MKKLTKVLSVCTLMGVLVGCGNKDTATANTNSAGAVTLNIWAMGEEAKSLGVLASNFEKQNPNIHVVVQSIPWAMVHQKLLTAIAGDSTPDVSMMGTSFMAEMVKLGTLEELSPYLAKDSSVKLTDFIPSNANSA